MTASSTVALRDVRKRYRGTDAVAGIDLDLYQGITGLLGPNGAGKTTLLRMMATVLAPDDGSIRLLGHDTSDGAERTRARRSLGYVPQELGFPRGFTAFQFVEYIAVLKEWDDVAARRAEVRRVLAAVGLSEVSTKRIRALSGGMRRRVALAQSLLGTPSLLVLDEPTTGLDPEQRASLRAVLSEAGHRATVVISTHQTEDVAALCDRVIVLDAGAVCFDGGVSDLIASAAGRVWTADVADPRAMAAWRTGTGQHRHVGDAPPDAALVEPTLEDAYLLLRGGRREDAEVAA